MAFGFLRFLLGVVEDRRNCFIRFVGFVTFFLAPYGHGEGGGDLSLFRGELAWGYYHLVELDERTSIEGLTNGRVFYLVRFVMGGRSEGNYRAGFLWGVVGGFFVLFVVEVANVGGVGRRVRLSTFLGH